MAVESRLVVGRRAALLVGFVLVLAACAGASAEPDPDPDDWPQLWADADGQTVRWWLFGGDERVNRFVDDHVAPAAADLGVTVDRIPVADTVDAVHRVIAEQEASRDRGTVDLLWVNGENFALGKQVGLWLEDWARRLPNAALVDWDDDTIATDFGVPVEGQESPWSRAAFVFAYDSAHMAEPPGSFAELLDHARVHPGRVTYPAPPDFTGSAFVRQAVAALGEDEAFELLAELKPLQWRQGQTYPGSESVFERARAAVPTI